MYAVTHSNRYIHQFQFKNLSTIRFVYMRNAPNSPRTAFDQSMQALQTWQRAGIEIANTQYLRAQLKVSYFWLSQRKKKLLQAGDEREKLDISGVYDRIAASAFACPELTRLTIKNNFIRQVRLFHQARAGLMSRKHDKNAFQAEHDEDVTECCILYHKNKFGCDPSPRTVTKWVLHDAGEDYGVTFEEIENFTDAKVAQSVRTVTIPPELILRKKYPNLKRKIDLKNHFKSGSVALYAVDELTLKLFDTLDALKSYVRNIEKGEILVTFNQDYADRYAEPPIFLASDLIENMEGRYEFIKLLTQRAMAIHNDPAANPDGLDTASMTKDIIEMFWDESEKFQSAVFKAARNFTPPEYLEYPDQPSDIRQPPLFLLTRAIG